MKFIGFNTYDENGHTGYRTGMTDASGETRWQYDPKGRVVKEIKRILNNTFTTQWTYDSQDRIDLMTYPDGEMLRYEYLKQGGVKTVNSNRAILLVDTLVNNNGKVIEQRFTDFETNAPYKTTYSYHNWIEDAGRLKSIYSSKELPENNRRWFIGQEFGYDQVGNITHVTDNLNNHQQLTYGYDALNRLVSASVEGEGHGFYDPQVYSYNRETGNLASKTGVGEYVYSAQKPHAVVQAGGSTFDYDANGNMTLRNLPGGASNFEYVYNAENKIVEIQKNGVTTRRFVYDGDGNRVYEIVFEGFEDMKPEETFFVGNYYQQKVQGERLLTDQIEAVTAEYMSYFPIMHKERGKGNTSYYYADGQRIAMRVEGTYYYVFGDHLGSTTTVVQRDNGERVGYQLYEPWGTTRYSAGNQHTDYAYTGQMQVDDIYYYNARWYDPAIGRFMQADTIVPSHQGTQGFDRYAYVNNNPINGTDPTGHWFCSDHSDVTCVEKDSEYTEHLVILAVQLTDEEIYALPKYKVYGQDKQMSVFEATLNNSVLAFNETEETNLSSKELAAVFLAGVLRLERIKESIPNEPYNNPHFRPQFNSFHKSRFSFDSPFYNLGGKDYDSKRNQPAGPSVLNSNQQICFEYLGCMGRSVANYGFQGLFGGAAGETSIGSKAIAIGWKMLYYPKNRESWFSAMRNRIINIGYDFYKTYERK